MATVNATFFGFFDAPPALGRYFLAAEDTTPRGADVAVLGYGFWRAEYGGRNVLGETIPDTLPQRLVIATDAFALADPETEAAFEPMVARLRRLLGEACEEPMAPPGLAAWARAQRTL